MHRKELWAVLLVVVAITAVLVYQAARAIGQILMFNDSSNANTTALIDESGWQTYTNDQYGFSVNYPQDWQVSDADLSDSVPFISIGNPIDGTSTYALTITVQDNPDSLSSGEYVHNFLTVQRAQDAQNSAAGPSPSVVPQFTKSFILTVNGLPAFELFHVFEFDRSAEQIYVAHNTIALRFDFPVAENNPNIASPIKNNAIAHEIVNTLTFN